MARTSSVHGAKNPPLSAESIAAGIEEVWLRITRLPAKRRVDVYITRRGVVGLVRETSGCAGAEFVGTYTAAVTLADFRDHVFHAWESMQR